MFPFSTTEEPPLHCQILLVPEKYHPIPPETHPIPVTGPLPLPPIPFTRMQGFLQSPLKPHPSIAGSTARDRIPSPSATSPSGSPIYTAANLPPHSPSVPGLVLHLPPTPATFRHPGKSGDSGVRQTWHESSCYHLQDPRLVTRPLSVIS